MGKASCPICNKDYHNIAISYWVCKRHEDWIVTVCEFCGQVSFSDCVGICPNCLNVEDLDYAHCLSEE